MLHTLWIPAFAGMTKPEFFERFLMYIFRELFKSSLKIDCSHRSGANPPHALMNAMAHPASASRFLTCGLAIRRQRPVK